VSKFPDCQLSDDTHDRDLRWRKLARISIKWYELGVRGENTLLPTLVSMPNLIAVGQTCGDIRRKKWLTPCRLSTPLKIVEIENDADRS